MGAGACQGDSIHEHFDQPVVRRLAAQGRLGRRVGAARDDRRPGRAGGDPAKSIFICGAQMLNVQGTDITYTYTGPACTEIGAGKTGTFYFFFSGSSDSSNQVFSFNLSITWGHQCPCGDDGHQHAPVVTNTITVDGTPPGGICQCGAAFIS